ncbi:nuclear receptor-interacting protein 1 [Conger conger]|uniref:nuclear receptor-interacting protein 1 n=1 Tax=Conger conger TaxID=82655 RepID=UPI002A5A757D|nr:nuclear receptor-interacting protein 1 [Conger conger]XP_061106117.1 nuclear receptor-interacting protein 1 [Conger conger]XP_061106118.1 nuclear receptor-interacting protein 1 [Conger conger]XP_061106119.1 nuclear receptor-interacting protein 1 [Conger conger]
MTHGEEPGSETHQDSVVLTYLEGLLMHPVAGGPGATATRRSEAEHSNREQGNKDVRAYQQQNHGTKQESRRLLPSGATQHLRKARLLHSEAWNEPESQRGPAPAGNLNGQSSDHHTEALDGSPQGESTMLASLLQSFSSRLQSVAMSKQITQNVKEQDAQVKESPLANKEALQCYETASSRLKGLMKKSKLQNHNSVPHHRQPSQERLSESSHATQTTGEPAASDSCAARLKAVANLVKIRSSPTPSPKPSVACSQLALLLSSEAHLQQYSREQALKAQLSARSASERLAAIATQKTQDKNLPNIGQPQMAPDMLSSLNAQKGTLLPPALDSSKQSPTPIPGQSRAVSSPRSPHPFREKRPFDKHNRPSQNCSSLLLLLLNNHNPQKPINGSGHLDEDYSVFPSHGSPLLSDSEYSNHENSLNKDSSDAESSYSSCSPIDLSVKSRIRGSVPMSSTSSLDKLTESLINKWKPETPGLQLIESRELKNSPDIKSHHEVTLMQLLLDHKNNEKVNQTADNPDLRHDITTKPNSAPAGRLTPTAVCKETRMQSPSVGLTTHLPLPSLSHGQDINGTASPYSLYASAHVQSSPLDLCKSKSCSGENVQEPAFSASKLLQNLAQCGLQNTSPSPPPKALISPSKRHSLELQEKPMTLLERLTAPIQRNRTPVLEGSHVSCVPFVSESPPLASEIENLLERRTVLQLLLGTASHKDKPSAKQNGKAAKGSLEKQADKLLVCDTPSGPLLDLKIKTEPREEGHLSNSYEEAEQCQIEHREHVRLRPMSLPLRDVKAEPSSTEGVPKDGLLSQLLKHRPRNFQADTLMDLHVSNMKEERGEYQGPSVPKKRKLCVGLEDHLISDPFLRTVDRPTHQDATDSFSIPGTPEQRKPMSPPEAHAPIRHPQSTSPPQDGRGFNVLKQLLLSDNCLKDLSHPRTSTSPSTIQAKYQANGNATKKSDYNPELMNSQWNPGALGVVPAQFRTVTTALASTSMTGSSWGSHVACQESPKLNLIPVKRETEGPIQWLISGAEKQDSYPDSPRLTKSNPILYYMLQKGYSHMRKEAREQGDTELCGIKVKEESVGDRGDVDHRLSWKHHSPLQNKSHGRDGEQVNGSLEKL